MKIANMLIVATLILGLNQVSKAEEPSRRDQLRIEVQQICPVSGEQLGEHGPPIQVTVGKEGETVFYCCEACRDGKIDDEHWATIHASIAKAQGVCLVMKMPLPENAKWSIVKGQVVYVCCPPCSKKVAADPAKYLEQIDGHYADALSQAKKEASDTQSN